MTEPAQAPSVEDLLAHAEFVRGLARSLLFDPHAADDVVQQTWLAAIEHPPRRAGGPRAWLGTVLRNFVRRGHRGEGRRARRETAVAEPERVASPTELAEQHEARRGVVDAVLGLAEPFRTAVVLRYFEGLPPRDIAARLAVPAGTVASRLHRAHGLLRERLDRARAGDRKRWCLALLAVAGGPSAAEAAEAAAGGAGTALALGGNVKLALLGAVLVGASVVAWEAVRAPRGGRGADPEVARLEARVTELEGELAAARRAPPPPGASGGTGARTEAPATGPREAGSAVAGPAAPAPQPDVEAQVVALLATLDGGWRQAHDVGRRLAALDPDPMLPALEKHWPRIPSPLDRRKMLEPLTIDLHAGTLRLLEMEVADPDARVRGSAVHFARSLRLRNLGEDPTATADWLRSVRGRRPEEVLAESARECVEGLRRATPMQVASLASEVAGLPRSDAATRALLAAGLGDVLRGWLESGSPDVKSAAFSLLSSSVTEDGGALREPSVRAALRDALGRSRGMEMAEAMQLLLALKVMSPTIYDGLEVPRILRDWLRPFEAGSPGDPEQVEYLAIALRLVPEHYEGRAAPTPVEPDLLAALERLLASADARVVALAAGTIGDIVPDEAYLRRSLVPLLDRVPEATSPVLRALSRRRLPWVAELALPRLRSSDDAIVMAAASALSQLGDPRFIPEMIAAIQADNTARSIYGIGHSGLASLTGVPHDPSHDGAWWGKWWQENKHRYGSGR